MGNPKPADMVATSLLMPKVLHKKLKTASIRLEDTMANIMVTAISEYLNTIDGKKNI